MYLKNKSALFILLIFNKTMHKSKLSLKQKNWKWGSNHIFQNTLAKIWL